MIFVVIFEKVSFMRHQKAVIIINKKTVQKTKTSTNKMKYVTVFVAIEKIIDKKSCFFLNH